MATVALLNPDTRILPLAQADLTGLEALFDQQCAEWLSLLRWDYSGPSRLIREVARQRDLSGFVAMAGNTTVGFAFYVLESNRCSIGDVYVAKSWRNMGVDRQMIEAILEKLNHTPRLRRIESQCVSIDNDEANRLLESIGFERFERLYMLADLAPLDKFKPRPEVSEYKGASQIDINIRGWKEEDFAQAARIIHGSYRGKHDSRINSQYRTEEGCAELLSILTDHIWCGDFLPQVTRVAVSRASGNRLGVLLASRIASGIGHIGQISILPAYQGLGLGCRLVTEALTEFKQRGFRSVTLAVTAANERAFRLYQSTGFRTIHQFPVFYRELR